LIERQIALLRGINLGPHNRVAMPALRDLLSGAGFDDVRTYVQSGNLVLSSGAAPPDLEAELARLIAERFAVEVEVVVRTGQELADVVDRNPLAGVAVEPKRYQVTFLAEPLAPERIEQLAELATGSERFSAHGRELYAWHPDGVARSKLWAKLGSKGLGVKATSRNWTTVTTLLAMAEEE
jgi:uncharacterized protein (DUF1697 family)